MKKQIQKILEKRLIKSKHNSKAIIKLCRYFNVNLFGMIEVKYKNAKLLVLYKCDFNNAGLIYTDHIYCGELDLIESSDEQFITDINALLRTALEEENED